MLTCIAACILFYSFLSFCWVPAVWSWKMRTANHFRVWLTRELYTRCSRSIIVIHGKKAIFGCFLLHLHASPKISAKLSGLFLGWLLVFYYAGRRSFCRLPFLHFFRYLFFLCLFFWFSELFAFFPPARDFSSLSFSLSWSPWLNEWNSTVTTHVVENICLGYVSRSCSQFSSHQNNEIN